MKNWIQAARVFVIGASVLPVIFGTLLAFSETGALDWVLFVLTLLGVSLIHFAANLFNDYYDFKSGADIRNTEAVFPFSGGSRVIVEGRIKPESVFKAAAGCMVLAGGIGAYLTYTSGIWVSILGAFGILSSILYVHPRFNLINLGIGEWVVGLDFGILTVAGAYYVQAGRFSLSSILAAVPIALIISLILLANEFPDFAGDGLVSKNTAVVRLGRKKASYLIAALLCLTAVSTIINALLGFQSLWSLAGLLTLPFLVNAAMHALRHYDNIPKMLPANISIIHAHLFMNAYLAAACLSIGKWKAVSILLIFHIFMLQLYKMKKLQLFGQLAGQLSLFKSGGDVRIFK